MKNNVIPTLIIAIIMVLVAVFLRWRMTSDKNFKGDAPSQYVAEHAIYVEPAEEVTEEL